MKHIILASIFAIGAAAFAQEQMGEKAPVQPSVEKKVEEVKKEAPKAAKRRLHKKEAKKAEEAPKAE